MDLLETGTQPGLDGHRFRSDGPLCLEGALRLRFRTQPDPHRRECPAEARDRHEPPAMVEVGDRVGWSGVAEDRDQHRHADRDTELACHLEHARTGREARWRKA